MRTSEGRYLIGMGIDISERRRIEESLRLSETRFRAVVENITEVISILDVNGISLYQSPSLTKIYGYEQDDFIGRNGLSLVHPDDLDKAHEHFAALLASPGTVSTLAYRYRHANGGWVDVESNAVALLDEPAIGGVLITSRDITTRKRVERALAEREAYLKTILDSQPECVKLLDRQGHLLDMNLAGLAMLEADSLEQVRGHCVCPLVTDHDRAAFMESLEAVFRGESRRFTFQITTLKGNHRWLETHAVPIWEEGGIPQVQSCLGLTRDITERHDMDEALRLTQYALDQYSDGVFRINREGRFEYVNREACRNLGYSEDELLAMHVSDIDPDFPAERWPEQWQLLELTGKKLFESRHRRKDGSIYPVEVSSNYVRLGEREVHIAYVRDITERKQSEHALHLTRHAIDVAALAFEWYDDTGRIIDVNTQCCKDLGYSRDEMLQLRLCDIDPDFPVEQWDSVWQHIKASGSLTAETTHRRKDGSLFPVLVTANHVEFDGREYIFTYAQDVTERNRVERELKATQPAIHHASAAFEWINAEGQVISCNIQAHRALGYERDEFVGLRVWDYDPDMSPERWRTLWDALRRDGHAMLESRHQRKDGSVFPIEVTVNRGVFGDQEYCFAYITDISERKAAEERLRLTQYAVDSSSIAFQWIRQDGRVMGCNRRAHESLGLTREELIGMRVWDFDPDFHAEGMAAHWVELKRVGKMTFETRHRHKDGHVFQVEVTSNYGEFDGQEYTFTYSVDITERKAAEEHLRLIQYAVDSSSVAFEWLDLDGKIISGNILAYESLGYTRDEFVDLHVWDFTPGLTVELWRAHVAQLRERGSEFIEGEHRRKDGTVYPIEVRANYVQFGEREYVFSYINDISERKVAEQALRDSQSRLAELIDFLPDATFAIDTQGVVIAWNRAMEAMSGASKESVLGQGDRAYAQAFYGHKRPMLVDLLFNDDPSIAKSYSVLRREGEALVTEDQVAYLYGDRRAALWAKTAPLRDAEGRVTGAVEVIRDITEQKDAERELRFSEERFRSVVSNTPVLIFEFDDEGVFKLSEGRGLMALGMKPGQLVHTSVCEFFHDDSVVCEHIREAISGKPAQFTARVGKAVFETFFNPVSDARSGRVSVIGVAVDITERTEREADLQQKTDEMTRFTYTVSHDLKSPLVTIRTFLGFLEQDIHKQDDERIAKDMGFIRNAAERMARLLEELLELSRIGRVVNNPVDTPFGALVHEAVGLVAGRIAERGVEVATDDPPLLIHGDRPRLVEVFQNLIDNAVKFMGTQAKPRIEIGAEARDGAWVFHVRDNGIGVDERYLHKVFGLFEKLDPNAEGTGIGLTLVKRIIEVHGGRIWVESAGPGQGTCFYFTLDGAAVSRLDVT
jgi:PAS domain S-box-containing protein